MSSSTVLQQYAQEPHSLGDTPEKEVSLQGRINRLTAEQSTAQHLVSATANPLLAAAIVQRGGEIAELQQILARAQRKRNTSSRRVL